MKIFLLNMWVALGIIEGFVLVIGIFITIPCTIIQFLIHIFKS